MESEEWWKFLITRFRDRIQDNRFSGSVNMVGTSTGVIGNGGYYRRYYEGEDSDFDIVSEDAGRRVSRSEE